MYVAKWLLINIRKAICLIHFSTPIIVELLKKNYYYEENLSLYEPE